MDDNEFLRSLRTLYKAKLPKKMHEIESEWAELNTTWESDKFKNFHNSVHKFCGSSGSYGFPEISVVVRELEVYVKKLLHENKSLSAQETAEIHRLLQKVKIVVDAAIAEKNI